MVGIFYASFTDIRHMAIGTRYSPLTVDTHLMKLVSGMLRLKNWCPAQCVCIVFIVHRVVILLHSFYRHTAVLRKNEIVAALLEIIFGMALRTNQRAHLLMRCLIHIFSHTLPCLIKCRTRGFQVHRFGVMAI